MRLPGRFCAALTLCGLSLWGCSQTDGGAKPPAAADPARDPTYAAYAFGRDDRTVDLGTQPLALPEGPVGELLARDRVLASQLGADGIALRTHAFRKGAELNAFLQRGDLEGGIAGDMPTLAAAAGGRIVVAAMVKQGFSSIVSRQPMLVRDLKGKRIATGLGSTAHFTLLNALGSEGLGDRDVTLVDVAVGDMAKALEAGEIDAFCAWEPTPAAALAAHPEYHVVHRGINTSFLYFRRDYSDRKPEAARGIVAAVSRACRWMRGPGNLDRAARWSIGSAARFLGRPFGPSPESVASITRADLLDAPGAPQIDPRLLQADGLLAKELRFLKTAGKISPDATWEAVCAAFDRDLLREVLRRREAYQVDRVDYRSDPPGARP